MRGSNWAGIKCSSLTPRSNTDISSIYTAKPAECMCKAMPYITVCELDLERLFSAREDGNEGISFQSILAHQFRQQLELLHYMQFVYYYYYLNFSYHVRNLCIWYKFVNIETIIFIIFLPFKAKIIAKKGVMALVVCYLNENVSHLSSNIGCCWPAFYHMQTLNLDSNTVNLGLECAPWPYYLKGTVVDVCKRGLNDLSGLTYKWQCEAAWLKEVAFICRKISPGGCVGPDSSAC